MKNQQHTTSSNAITGAAEAIWQARSSGVSIAPISQTFGISTLQDAYAISRINVNRHVTEGTRRVIGHKVGLTSKAVQQQLGVAQPDFGTLLDDMEFLHGQEVPMARLIQPKIEAEVAFVLGSDLVGENPSWSEFIQAVAFALPALEIVDSAITDWKISLADTVADNASCGLYVLGDQPSPLGAVSLGNLGMQMSINGTTVSVGTGAACLGHPLRAAYWLAQTLANLGEGLHAGQVILSGALGPMVPVKAGDVVLADLGHLGSVSCRMV
jgi:2-keto-4-pentenoate hydratase